MKMLSVLSLVVISFAVSSPVKASQQKQVKSYMYQFVTEASELRMADIKGDKPNWKQIQVTLKKMRKTITEMEQSFGGGKYRPSLNQLSSSVNQLEKMSLAKDPEIAAAYERMTQKCLRCHTAHLPHTPLSFEEPLKRE